MYLIPNISEFPAKSYEVEVVECHLQFSMPSSLTRMALFGLILPCFSTIHLNTITSLSLSTNTLIPPDWPPGPRGVLHQHLRQPGPQTRCKPGADVWPGLTDTEMCEIGGERRETTTVLFKDFLIPLEQVRLGGGGGFIIMTIDENIFQFLLTDGFTTNFFQVSRSQRGGRGAHQHSHAIENHPPSGCCGSQQRCGVRQRLPDRQQPHQLRGTCLSELAHSSMFDFFNL